MDELKPDYETLYHTFKQMRDSGKKLDGEISAWVNAIEKKNQVMLDLFTSAIEGGSNYWYIIENHNKDAVGCKFLVETPFKHGGFVTVSSMEEPELPHVKIDLEKLTKGWDVFKRKAHSHFMDVLNDNADAATGDVFLQCVCFGDIIYG